MWGDTIKIALGGVIALAGALVAQGIQARRERMRWIADTRIGEYRELLQALAKALVMLRLSRDGFAAFHEPALAGNVARADDLVVETIKSRIYIASEVHAARVMSLWADAVNEFKGSDDSDRFLDMFDELCRKIVELALKEKP